MSAVRERTPPPTRGERALSRTPMHHATVAASADPVALLKALHEDAVRQVAAAKERNGLGAEGPGSPELDVRFSDKRFDEEAADADGLDEPDEVTTDGLPRAVAELRAANADLLRD